MKHFPNIFYLSGDVHDAKGDPGTRDFTIVVTVGVRGKTKVFLLPEGPSSTFVGWGVSNTAIMMSTSGTGPLLGTVAFVENGETIPRCAGVLVVSGSATRRAPFPSATTVIVSATYAHDLHLQGGTSSSKQVVTKGTTSLALSSSTPLNAGSNVSYTVSVAENSGTGTLTGTVSFTENGSPVATCQNLALTSAQASFTIHFASGGSYSIGASYANDASFSCSSSSLSETVYAKPVFASASSTGSSVGHYFGFQVTATGNPAPTLSVAGILPKGVTFNAATGMLSGTPADGSSGTYTIYFTATNSVGSVTQKFTLTVSETHGGHGH